MAKHTVSETFRTSFPEIEKAGFRTDAWKSGVASRPEELTPYFETLLHALAAAAKLESATGITLLADRPGQPEQARSYQALYQEALAVAAALAARGVCKGDRVVIVLPTSFEFVISFFGIGLAGAVPVPAYPPAGLRAEAGLEKLCHIAAHAEAAVCVTNKRLKPLLGQMFLQVPSLRHLEVVEELTATNEPPPRVVVGADDPGFIQYTSGSTGKPKGVLLTHRNLMGNLHAIGQAMRIRRTDVTVSWLPLYHDMGLIGTLLFSVYWRIPLVLMSPLAFLSRPSRWLRAIHDHRGTLSPAPNFAYALCVKKITAEEREGLDLSSWRLALNGAEPINPRTVTEFVEAYRPQGLPPGAVLPVYGLAEASLAVTFPEPETPCRILHVEREALSRGEVVPVTGEQAEGAVGVVCVGKAVPGHEVALIDDRGEPVGERRVGHVLVRGPSIMNGYFRDEAKTAEAFRDGWLWTGDLGFTVDGELYISGRAKDLIILRGRNIYPADIEHEAERIEGIRGGSAVAFGVTDEAQGTERAVLVCETRVEDAAARAALAEQITIRVTETVDLRLDQVVLVGPGTLPKTSSGKKQRSLTRELFLRGELEKRRPSAFGRAAMLARSAAGYLLARVRRATRRST